MKLVSLTIHARSALVGAAMTCAVWLAMSALPQQSTSSRPLQVQLDPDPSLIVRLVEGKPYTVPTHRLLAIKTVFLPNISNVLIKINDETILSVHDTPGGQATFAVPIVAQPGDVVSIASEFPLPPGEVAVASAYLSHD